MEKLRVSDVLDRTAKAHAEKPALMTKAPGGWRATSYRDYRAAARLAGRGMIALGLRPGPGVAILGGSRAEWLIADLGAILAGGVPAGIYVTSSAEQARYVAGHADAAIAVVENEAALPKLLAARAELPLLKAIVLMEGRSPEPGVLTWSELLSKGESHPEADLDARIAAQRPAATCTLIYTSGTTGNPKAVMLTHENVTWTAQAGAQMIGIEAGSNGVCYLPLSHIAEQIVSLHGPLAVGGCTWFAPSLEALGETLREVRPDYFFAVPRVWEKMQAKITAAGAGTKGLKRRLIAWARATALESGRADQAHRGRPLAWPLAKRLVVDKVREKLGLDRCKIQAVGAAPTSRDTHDFFLSLGLPLYEVYGMSECTGPATTSLPRRYRTGKAGFALPGTEVKIAADGEICMRGPHIFKGYFKDPAATAEALDADGWLHSGDIGTLDPDGFLEVTDRKKDLLITAGAENVAPQPIEAALKAIGAVAQAVVVGDRRRYLAALLTLDPEQLPQAAEAAGSPARDPQAAARCERFRAYLQHEIDRVNGQLARVQTIKRWEILPGELSVDGGELTPTLKVRRRVVGEKYAREIESLYG